MASSRQNGKNGSRASAAAGSAGADLAGIGKVRKAAAKLGATALHRAWDRALAIMASAVPPVFTS
jgi:hypothetical protein